jgi:hypothetical protein
MVDSRKPGFTKIVIGETKAPERADAGAKGRRDDPARRIEALAAGREQDLREIQRLRAELKLVVTERDRLRQELTTLEGMQVDTLALDEDWDANQTRSDLPSIDELMKGFGGNPAPVVRSHSSLLVETAPEPVGDEPEEMISPAAIVLDSGNYRRPSLGERFLVLLDDDSHPQFLLDHDLLTIGRSDSADIKIADDSISRIHARILRIGLDSVIEDAGSKNGTRVNGEACGRHVLAHGDLVQTGSVSLRFVDPAELTEDAD